MNYFEWCIYIYVMLLVESKEGKELVYLMIAPNPDLPRVNNICRERASEWATVYDGIRSHFSIHSFCYLFQFGLNNFFLLLLFSIFFASPRATRVFHFSCHLRFYLLSIVKWMCMQITFNHSFIHSRVYGIRFYSCDLIRRALSSRFIRNGSMMATTLSTCIHRTQNHHFATVYTMSPLSLFYPYSPQFNSIPFHSHYLVSTIFGRIFFSLVRSLWWGTIV